MCLQVAPPLLPPRTPRGPAVLNLTTSQLLWFPLQLGRAQLLQA